MTQQNPLATDDVARRIGDSFAVSEASRLPKHVRLYDAIVANIEAGVLAPGDKLPGERDLCGATGISLGTVQKGLAQLVTDGRVQREHGRGTFVRTGHLPLTDLWHYRFREPGSDQLLPVYARVVERAQVLGDAEVARALGLDRSRFVRISRVLNISDRFKCYSEMHLPFSRFSGLMEMPQEDIEGVNLKLLLANRFNSPTIATTQTVQVKTFTKEIVHHIGARQRTSGLLLQIVGIGRGGIPITFQRIYVPPSECEMEVGAEGGPALVAAVA